MKLDKLAIGITAVPTPFTDSDSDLFYVHKFMTSHFQFISGIGVFTTNNSQVQIDSRAMRKVEEGQDVAAVLEVSSLSGGGSISFVAGRQLIKLH